MGLRKLLSFTVAIIVIAASVAIPVPIAQAAACPCTIWPASATPANASVNNTTPVEVGVKFRADTAGYITALRFYKASNNTGTHIGNLWKADGTLVARATFVSETSSGWQQVNFAQPVQVTPNATYVASYYAPNGNYAYTNNYFTASTDNGSLHALKNGTNGGNGLYSYAGSTSFPTSSYQATNYWVDVVFRTESPAPTASILIITTSTNKFSSYYGEILKNEGYSFETADLDNLTPALLSQYDVVILGQTPLSAGRITALTDWVNTGGHLIAMRPDKQLAGLAGLSDAGSSLSNQYLKINTASGPGAGLTDQSIQFHGAADNYTLDGATRIAELFSSAGTSTGRPAVSLRSVGANGGQVAVFAYDLAKSVVLTRQGNPAWAGQNRETYDAGIRANDLFFGDAAGDSQPDWLDLNKVAIPQADEQQRLLGNLIVHMNQDTKPIPHFWYLPKGKKAAVIMTADDHATGDGGAQVTSRLQRYMQLSPAGCNVSQWECVRSSHYFYLNNPMSLAQAQSYSNQGFDLGVHLLVNGSALANGAPSDPTSCGTYTAATVDTYLTQQLSTFASRYPGVAAPVSNRTHCIVWSDWNSQAKAEANHGIRLDTNYYYWPGTWTQGRPGMMNGGGFPMRFADTDGSLVDSYQAMTHMQDEAPNPQTYPFTINTLLDNALGPNGYYGVFTANMHTDTAASLGKSDSIIAAAQARGVPIISARQMVTWLDGRNNSKFTNLTWNGSSLTFDVSVASGAQNMLQAMLPTSSSNGPLQALTAGGNSVPYTVETIKGVEYARFAVSSSSYTAAYGSDASDTIAPSVTTVTPPNNATDITPTAQVKATFSEAVSAATVNSSTFELRNDADALIPAAIQYDAGTRTATLTPTRPLVLGSTYTATVKGGTADPRIKDTAGNELAANVEWSFATRQTLSLWEPNATPSSAASADLLPVELGVRFTSDVSGYIKGIRFYKGSGNTGTHIGNLWSASGVRLASITFSGETSSGWQQALFTTPVAITAGTPYVASYFAPRSHYAETQSYFAQARNNATLHAPQDAITAHNGLFAYSPISLFPALSWNSTNYWVDVVFSNAP